MATKKNKETPPKDVRAIYESHNDESARDGEADKQCQCADCKEYRESE